MAIGGQHHVCRFYVAVDDATAVCEIERFGNFCSQPERFVRGQAAARQARLERDTLHELHREEAAAVMLADLIDLADERMIELGRGPGLPEQPRTAIRAITPFARVDGQEKLQRDAAIEGEILGGIDLAHPALADAGVDAVVRKLSLSSRLEACHRMFRDGETQAGLRHETAAKRHEVSGLQKSGMAAPRTPEIATTAVGIQFNTLQ